MDTANPQNVFIERKDCLTQARDRGPKVPQDRRSSVAHLPFHRQLGFDINLTAPSTQDCHNYARNNEDAGKGVNRIRAAVEMVTQDIRGEDDDCS
jgi:hypothetical protein